MTKRLILVFVCLAAGLLLIEVAGLLQMKASLAGYAHYWRQRPASGEFVYVALGDSAAQGIGASQPQRGYVGLLTRHLEQATGKTVRIVNLSVSGAKVADVIAKQLPQLKNYQADLITVEIGGNDVINYNSTAFSHDFTALAAALPPQTIVSNLPFFGGRIRRDAEVKAANHIVATAAQQNHLPLVDLYDETARDRSPLNNSYDLFHPSDRGYKNWEAAFWKTIGPNLGSSDNPQ
ncbi:MAG: SGNH/GDSL hydrolase family protein [Candidatus Saccharibacteria bacterium]